MKNVGYIPPTCCSVRWKPYTLLAPLTNIIIPVFLVEVVILLIYLFIYLFFFFHKGRERSSLLSCSTEFFYISLSIFLSKLLTYNLL